MARCSHKCKKHCGPKRSAKRSHSARRRKNRTQRQRGGWAIVGDQIRSEPPNPEL